MKIRLRIIKEYSDVDSGLVWRAPPREKPKNERFPVHDYPAVLEVFDQVGYEDGSSEWKWVPVEVVDSE
jgi:hypothetical protein